MAEPGVGFELPHRVHHVLPQLIEKGEPSHVPALLPPLLEPANRLERRKSRVGGTEASGDELLDLAIEVILQLLVELPIHILSMDQRAQAQAHDAKLATHVRHS